MTNELQVKDPIDRRDFDPSHYFQSFLAKAAGLGLLENTEEIRRETILLASKMAQRYTFGASSSVTAETAQGLLESAMYCIGRRLKAAETGEALEQLKTLSIEKVWNEGKELLRGDLAEAGTLLSRLRESTFKTENEAYSGTLNEALPAFFAAYDIEYAAHETPCLIDYPLCDPPDKFTGVEYILEYLKRLSTENCFCIRYAEQIEPLFRGYSPDWRDLNINIFELALTNAIGRVLCGKDAAVLDMCKEDRKRLQSSLRKAHSKLKVMVSMAAHRVCPETEFPKPVRDYTLKAAGQIVPRLKNALETESLGSVFIMLKTKGSYIARFNDSAAMDDETFRSVTDEIRSCRHVSDKLVLIKQNIKSIADLMGLLAASCLFKDEYEALFRALDDETLALLYKLLPEEGAMHITEGESEWHNSLIRYLKKSGKTGSVTEAAKAIEL